MAQKVNLDCAHQYLPLLYLFQTELNLPWQSILMGQCTEIWLGFPTVLLTWLFKCRLDTIWLFDEHASPLGMAILIYCYWGLNDIHKDLRRQRASNKVFVAQAVFFHSSNNYCDFLCIKCNTMNLRGSPKVRIWVLFCHVILCNSSVWHLIVGNYSFNSLF